MFSDAEACRSATASHHGNAATGDARNAAIAQVVNELVRQQKTMREHMGTLDQQMMMRIVGGRGMMNK